MLLCSFVIAGRGLWTPALDLTLFFLPGINSLFIMCTGIIRSNSLVGGRVRAQAWTPATERVTLNCTWHPSALATRPHGQVVHLTLIPVECVYVANEWMCVIVICVWLVRRLAHVDIARVTSDTRVTCSTVWIRWAWCPVLYGYMLYGDWWIMNGATHLLLLTRFMGQYCFTRFCRSLSSVTLRAGRARGRSGGRHCTAGQYGYVSLWRHLVFPITQS